MRPRRATTSAFTLLEVILAIGLAAMVSLVLYSSMSTAMRAHRTSESVEYASRVVGIVPDLIGRDLEQAVRPNGILAGEFVGMHNGVGNASSDELSFYTVSTDGTRASDDPLGEGVCRVELYVDSDQKPAALVRDVYRNLLATAQDDPEQEILCRGVESFQVLYYDGSQWLTDWDSTTQDNTMPVAVSITMLVNTSDTSRSGGANGAVREVRRTIILAGGVSASELSDSTTSGAAQ